MSVGISRGSRRAAALAAALVLACVPAVAQTAGTLYVRPLFELFFPLNTHVDPTTLKTEPNFATLGFGAGSALDFEVLPWLKPFVRGQYVNAPYSGSDHSLQSAEGNLGLGFLMRPTDRLSLRLDALGGLAQLFYWDSASSTTKNGMTYAAGARVGLEYRLAPALSLSLSGGYSTYLGGDFAPILSAVEAGLYFSYNLSAIGGMKTRLSVEDVRLDAVFPSLYAYYDDNAFGSVRIVNREDSDLRNVKVSFNASRYMDQPKVCAEYASLKEGGSVTVPVKALFNDTVLNITQGTDAKAEIVVEYDYLGSARIVRTPIDFRMHHRNAITWSDDRRAASFVSPTNPAALWFSKYASGIVRDRMRGDINKPLQYAIGMFEAERLYGLNYVVVPANDYSVKHGLKDYIDSVQFPHQTLSNRGGDCSDLAILFATLMHSVGVEAAFITIPGHIFSAFDTGLDEAAARSGFYDPGLLIFKDGKAWIPVEITMVKDGFIKAWRVGAKEWADNSRTGSAAFYRLPDCWKVYPSAAFPDVNPRFVLPDDAQAAMAFDNALDRFVAREIEPKVESLQAKVASAEPMIRANELGVLYANYGMLKESWKQLSEAAKAGSPEAWTNLGNVAYLRKDYKLALSYFQYSRRLRPDDDVALLGVARCQYELEDFKASDAAYAELRSRNPALASKFGYLASIFGGEGRAWSLAERFATTSWASALKQTAAAPSRADSAAAAAAKRAVDEAAAAQKAADEAAAVQLAAIEAANAAAQKAAADAEAANLAAQMAATENDSAEAQTAADESAAAQAAAAEAARLAAQKAAEDAARLAAQKAAEDAARLAAQKAAGEAAAAAKAEPAPPSISNELPVDQDLAGKGAVAAAPKATAAPIAGPAPDPLLPPVISAELPTDLDLAKKTADSLAQKPLPAVTVKPAAIEAEPEAAQAEPEAAQAEPEAAQVEPEAAAVEPEAVAVEPEAAAVEPEAAAVEPEAVAVEPEAAAVEPEAVAVEPEAVAVEPEAVAVEPAPEPVVVATVAAAPLGDSELPFSIGKELLLEGFEAVTQILGKWIVKDGIAKQTDRDAFFAKLAIPLAQDKRAFSYSFSARSTAPKRGWVGLGIHVFNPKSDTQKCFGAGDSLCIWLTRDPVHFKENITRLHLYRSVNYWNMKLIKEVPVAESIYDLNRFDITVDPVAGTVSVSLNGTERLVADGILDLHKGVNVLFRALDTAEFTDFKAEASK